MTFNELYISIKEKFKELNNGKSNIKLYGSKYFIPIEITFTKRLSQAILEYNIDDMNKIQGVLFNHIKNATINNFGKYTRTLEYFIYGQNGKDCQLAIEYENYEEQLVEIEKEVKFKSNIK